MWVVSSARRGHLVTALPEVLPTTTDDSSALRFPAAQGMVMITCNCQDFLTLSRAEPHAGLIILVRKRTRVAECPAILRLLGRSGEDGIVGNVNFAWVPPVLPTGTFVCWW